MKIIVNSGRFQIEQTKHDPWGIIHAPIDCEFKNAALHVKGPHVRGFMPEVHANLDVSVKSFVQAIQFAIDCPHAPHITPVIWPNCRAAVQETLLRILQSPQTPGTKPFELDLFNGSSIPPEWLTVNLTSTGLKLAEAYVEKQAATLTALAHGRKAAGASP